MIDVHKAQQIIQAAIPVLGSESVPLLESLGRVLARDIVATEDSPGTDISTKDGFTLHHKSLTGASPQSPVFLKIIGESAAGRPCGAAVKAGEAVRIMAGGMVPDGADTVVGLEIVTEDHGYVVCTSAPRRGGSVRLRGALLKNGETVFRAGMVVGPAEVGVLASLRRAYVPVHRRPLVAIATTGDELADFHEPASPSKTMSSNLYALAAQVLEAGAVPLCIGIVGDELETLQTHLREALHADVIITSGGMSKGRYDLVRESFAALGMDMKLSTLLGKPGKPAIFGKIGASLVFGLPGSPPAAMISFEQFIRPAILRMMGHARVPSRSAADDRQEGTGDGLFSLYQLFKQGRAAMPAENGPSPIPLRMSSP
ncbi:molybdopterin molybdotransferase MoeA [Desulfoprunum benzoelyticum]|uniref:Molybdopterin molybdenumtransferase n=1 Tax=Desulfoprunum benzoelyticum TaxID=1506996 RepID=A0A840UU73_9BACT|nr:molybdopterin molybdotransferase MoeA [Desulfoprunum benzoelyticum]MBB5346298.1 molybdopterin molybdotransferase [Desulfoprunum benzoelyticum]MBM9528703.1 molybdopterin molybdotransferase MoeA [Desulfoprunum benzoelyticum]